MPGDLANRSISTSRADTGSAEANSAEPIVVFDDVSIKFDLKPVLQNISFTVFRGETRIILGPAGGGKSVLMKLVDGLIRPDSGDIRVFGEDITTMKEVDLFKLRGRIGMVFQESALFDSLSVEDNVAYRLHEDRVSEEEAHKRVIEALQFVELEQTIAKFPPELSGGMRRRVSIARAIISSPDLILYDSPTGGLDPITSTTIVDLVIKQRDVSHTTALMITHRLQDAFLLARNRFNSKTGKVEPIPNDGIDDSTKFLVLNEGKVVFDGTTHELVHSTDPWLRDYLS
jgi:phospholipid/cholesterol/gamma-HCH transport system ATP-binding protein